MMTLFEIYVQYVLRMLGYDSIYLVFAFDIVLLGTISTLPSIISKTHKMTKKIAYHTYYYSIVDDITSVQLKSSTELPLVDVSSLQQWMETHQIGGVLSTESHYPWRMQQVPQAPYVVYYQGTLEVLNKPTLAIVGPRQISPYAQEVLENTFEHLRSFDVVTVSGMAPGVDTLCHELSLKYKIPTIAILGGGFR